MIIVNLCSCWNAKQKIHRSPSWICLGTQHPVRSIVTNYVIKILYYRLKMRFVEPCSPLFVNVENNLPNLQGSLEAFVIKPLNGYVCR